MANLCFKCRREIRKKVYFGLHAVCFKDWFDARLEDKFVAVTPEQILDERDLQRDYVLINSSFFQGKYKKYSATLNEDKFIFKINDNDFPRLQRAEYLSNQIAEFLSIPVAPYYLISFEGADCFVTKNFLYSTQYRRLTHIYHYLNTRAGFNVENLMNIILDTTMKPKDTEIFLKVVLFDSLIGNHDRHGRNLGFVTRGSQNRLAPIYDNCSYLGIEIENLVGADLNPLGKIATKTSKNPSMKDYMEELLRLKQINVLRLFNKKCKLDGIFRLIDQSFLPEKYRNAYKVLVNKRYKEFCVAYENFGI